MTFNEKIDKYMKENNIRNLKQLALKANIPYTTLQTFYKQKSADNSRLANIRKLSKYMNCSMDYLSYDEIEDENCSLNQEQDILKSYLLKKGFLKQDEDLTNEDLDKLIEFAKTNKQFIINEKNTQK